MTEEKKLSLPPKQLLCAKGHEGRLALVRERKEYYAIIGYESDGSIIVHYEPPGDACVDQDAHLLCEAEDRKPGNLGNLCLEKRDVPAGCRLVWDDEIASSSLPGPSESSEPIKEEEESSGLRTKISAAGGQVTISFSKPVEVLQFSPSDLDMFVKALLDKKAELGDGGGPTEEHSV